MNVNGNFDGLLIFIFLAWTVFAIAGYHLGKSKGKATEGLLLGMFLGGIGLIIIAVMNPTPEIEAQRLMEVQRLMSVGGGQSAAAWWPDPHKRHELRYWDGAKWTDHVSDHGTQSTNPVVQAPPAAPTPFAQPPPPAFTPPVPVPVVQTPVVPGAPAGWHPDPSSRHGHRYWDGSKWTEHVSTNGIQSTDRLP